MSNEPDGDDVDYASQQANTGASMAARNEVLRATASINAAHAASLVKLTAAEGVLKLVEEQSIRHDHHVRFMEHAGYVTWILPLITTVILVCAQQWYFAALLLFFAVLFFVQSVRNNRYARARRCSFIDMMEPIKQSMEEMRASL